MIKLNNRFSLWPHFSQTEIDAVTSVLKSGKVNYWTGGEGRAFESEFAVFTGCKHAVALANGTVALELALHALGIGEGDEVVVTPRTFIASASSIVLRGATPVFADVDIDSQNITAETIRRVLTPKTKAIIAVHLAGWPCDMDPIMELAKEHGLKIIEDCAQAVGAKYKGRRVGSMGDVAAFSFCSDKIMTTGGEGGMLVTNSEELWKRAWAYKDHGKSYDVVYDGKKHSGLQFRWLHESFGTNLRMTEMQAAIGRCQLKKLPEWLGKRKKNANILKDAFLDLSVIRVANPPDEIEHAYYKYYVFIRPERLKSNWGRDRIIREISNNGVPCFPGSCSELYLEKAFIKYGFPSQKRLLIARELGETSLMLLVHPTLTNHQMEKTVNIAKNVFERAGL